MATKQPDTENSGFTLLYEPGEHSTKYEMLLDQPLKQMLTTPVRILLDENEFTIAYRSSQHLAVVIDLIKHKEVGYSIGNNITLVCDGSPVISVKESSSEFLYSAKYLVTVETSL